MANNHADPRRLLEYDVPRCANLEIPKSLAEENAKHATSKNCKKITKRTSNVIVHNRQHRVAELTLSRVDSDVLLDLRRSLGLNSRASDLLGRLGVELWRDFLLEIDIYIG